MDAILIASDLRVSAVLTDLNLNLNRIGPEGAKALVAALSSGSAVLLRLSKPSPLPSAAAAPCWNAIVNSLGAVACSRSRVATCTYLYDANETDVVLRTKPDPQTCWIGCAHLAGLAQRKCAGKHILGRYS